MSNQDPPHASTSGQADPTPPSGTGAADSQIPSNGAIAPGEIILTEQFLSDPTWPSNLMVSLDKSNWAEWNKRLTLLSEGHGFSAWLSGKLKQPDISTHPKAHWIWANNDISLHAFILRHVSAIEYEYLGSLVKDGSAYAVYEQLKQRHEKLGLYTQVLLLKKGLELRFRHGTHLSGTISEIRCIYQQMAVMGPVDMENIFTVLLLNALGEDFQDLQSNIQATSNDTTFSVNYIIQRIQNEENLQKHRVDQGIANGNTEASIFVATDN